MVNMQVEVGAILEGKVTGITKFGVFVDLGDNKTGMVHISEVAPTFVNDIHDHVKENETVKVKVLSIADDGKISLSIRRALENEGRRPQRNFNRRGQRYGSRNYGEHSGGVLRNPKEYPQKDA